MSIVRFGGKSIGSTPASKLLRNNWRSSPLAFLKTIQQANMTGVPLLALTHA